MEVTKDSLHQRFSAMATEELVELQHTSDLTELARDVLEAILTERGVTPEERVKVIELLNEEATATVPLASIGRRFVAQIFDALAAFIILVVPFLIFDGESDTGIQGIGIAGYILYLLFQDGLPNGQSIGKRLVKIAVINKSSGKSCDIGESFVRNVFLVFLGFIDLLFIGSKYRQRLGDRAANTIVVNVEPESVEKRNP